MELQTGNAREADTAGTGWLVGFSPWTRHGGGLLHVPSGTALSDLALKWYDHPPGHDSGPGKPVSVGRTISILVSASGEFRLDFEPAVAAGTAAPRTVVLRRQGDYVAWDAGWHHRWHCVQAATVLTLRWVPGGAGPQAAEAPA